jgi:hypothetical protein
MRACCCVGAAVSAEDNEASEFQIMRWAPQTELSAHFRRMFKDRWTTRTTSMPSATLTAKPIHNSVSYQDILDAFYEHKRNEP